MKLIIEDSYKIGFKKILAAYPRIFMRLDRLTDEILESPRSGIGYPKQLNGYRPRVVWARRIVGKHRLVYEIKDKEDCIVFLSCYGHYKDH